jgi:hypothetical protein
MLEDTTNENVWLGKKETVPKEQNDTFEKAFDNIKLPPFDIS